MDLGGWVQEANVLALLAHAVVLQHELVAPEKFVPHRFDETRLAPKLTDLYRTPGIST